MSNLNPEWTKIRDDYYELRYTDASGQPHQWHAAFTRFTERGPRNWWAWPDERDSDWDENGKWSDRTLLDHRLADAQDEFLIMVAHGWMRPFGFVGTDFKRPVYAKDGIRRERVFIVAELTGRGICPGCRRLASLTTKGAIRHHGQYNRRCSGVGSAPLAAPRLEYRDNLLYEVETPEEQQ